MDELEKLLNKFNAELSGHRADVSTLKASYESLQKAVDGSKERDTEMQATLKDLQAAIDAKNQAIEELKTLVRNTESDLSQVDPQYVTRANGTRRCFPNAQRARQFGLFTMACMENGKTSEMARMALDKSNKALAEEVNATGGALVPEVFEPTLISMMEQYGLFRQFARNVPMAGERVTWPKLDGHVTVYYPGEAGTITASNPTFENVSLIAKKACALTVVSSEVDEDSAVSLGEIIMQDFARGFAQAEDEAGFLGNGSSTYWGFVGVAGALLAVDGTIGNIKSLVVGAGNAYSELLLSDFDKVVGTLPTYAESGARWYMSKYFYWTVVRPLLGAYSSGVPSVGLPFDPTQGGPQRLLGYEVSMPHVMPKAEANSQVCAVLADLNTGAYLGDRRRFEIARSRDAYFTTDCIGIRATRRHAINVFGVGDTSEAGPVCALITAAA
jgi:HK97 family phage major capsid protein